MKRPWFRLKSLGRRRWPVPVRPVGWLVLLFYVVGVIWIFWSVDRNSHSASDTLIGMMAPHFVLLAAVVLAVRWRLDRS